MPDVPVFRFAPSPNGLLHLGHAYSALYSSHWAERLGGIFLLRIEDTDKTRCTDAFEAQIYADLAWLGLTWGTPILRQSDNTNAYESALDHLGDMGLLYPCSCTRGDIRRAASAPQEGAPMHGPDGLVYPGTCRNKPGPYPQHGTRPRDVTLRLDMAQACLLGGLFGVGRGGQENDLLTFARIRDRGCRMHLVWPDRARAIFDHGEGDHLSANLGEAFHPAHDADAIILVHDANIARVVPAILGRLNNARCGRAHIAQHHIRTANAQLSAFLDPFDR